jgi:hypothetical protein
MSVVELNRTDCALLGLNVCAGGAHLKSGLIMRVCQSQSGDGVRSCTRGPKGCEIRTGRSGTEGLACTDEADVSSGLIVRVCRSGDGSAMHGRLGAQCCEIRTGSARLGLWTSINREAERCCHLVSVTTEAGENNCYIRNQGRVIRTGCAASMRRDAMRGCEVRSAG